MKSHSPPKIYINARFLSQKRFQGVQRYAIELLKALDSLLDSGEVDASKFTFILLSPQNIAHNPNFKHISLKPVGFLNGHFWEQIELPFYARDGLLLNLTGSAPLTKLNQIVTIHDVSVFAIPTAYSLTFRTWYQFLLTNLKNVAKSFVTVSYFSRQEIVSYLGIDKNKIHVHYEGCEHIFKVEADHSILNKHNLLGKRFIFIVSSMSYHKNVASVINAVEELADLNIYLVIVGISYPKTLRAPNLLLSDKKIYAGYINNSELRSLYEHSFCFIHPSLYEGFGLPPLEAMACGCPVIASNAASLPEICGDAALYCDPYNPSDIASKVKQLANNTELREDLVQKGKKRTELFTWEKCARDIYKLIDQGFDRN